MCCLIMIEFTSLVDTLMTNSLSCQPSAGPQNRSQLPVWSASAQEKWMAATSRSPAVVPVKVGRRATVTTSGCCSRVLLLSSSRLNLANLSLDSMIDRRMYSNRGIGETFYCFQGGHCCSRRKRQGRLSISSAKHGSERNKTRRTTAKSVLLFSLANLGDAFFSESVYSRPSGCITASIVR